ncbi:MAG: RagB/SusD family nutrient uptake outer membrane protein [Mucilaginibacter polytrichastri]|nr:RagB/SusD family nutrient uptake outer membrane protein [Mucilaginibacter polytrichastri]
MKRHSKKLIYLALTGLLFSGACTKLDETTFDSIQAEDYYKTEQEIVAAWLRPYSHLCGVYLGDHFFLNSLTTDETAWPVKGPDGYDNGDWIRMHQHTWTPQENRIQSVWDNFYIGVALCNNFLQDMDRVDFAKIGVSAELTKGRVVAETKVVRAFYYYHLFSMFGNIPLSKIAGNDPQGNPQEVDLPNSSPQDVFSYIESEIKANADSLPSKGGYETYGHLTKEGAYTLLAKLYLNAEATTGTAKWNEAIAACDEVINSKVYEQDTNWQAAFLSNNQNALENIFVIPYDNVNVTGFSLPKDGFAFQHNLTFNLDGGCNNGLVTQTAFYDSFKDDDLRKKQFLVGPQFQSDGKTPIQGIRDDSLINKPLVLRPYLSSFKMTGAPENVGPRVNKFAVRVGTRGDFDNDYTIFRYTDVLMMKAECLLRTGNAQGAVDLMNQARARCFPAGSANATYTTATLTLDELLAERGREFNWEQWRREDLIRFNKYNGTWWDKAASPEFRKLLPIPQRRLSNNPNLKQNPGY